MLEASELIHLACADDLIEAGIGMSCRALAYRTGRTERAVFDALRQIVMETACGLALRRYLTDQNIPFGAAKSQPFNPPGQYNLRLGGHTCRVQCRLMRREGEMQALLDGPATVPLDELMEEGRLPEDLYLFAFLIGKTAAGNQAYWIQPLPDQWARPVNWNPLKEFSFENEGAEAVRVEVGGLNERREFISHKMEAGSKQRREVREEFYSAAYLHSDERPKGRISLRSLNHPQACSLGPREWGNIRLEGKEIVLAGWMTQGEFHRQASLSKVGRRAKNLLMRVRELRPLGELFLKAVK